MNKFELKIGSIYARTTCYVKEKGIDKIEPSTSSCDGFGIEKFTFLLEDGLYLVQDGSNGCGINKRYWLQVYAGEAIKEHKVKDD